MYKDRRPNIGITLVATVICLSSLLADARDTTAQVRYRDEVFTSVSRSNAIIYGEAQNVRGDAQQLELDFYEPAGDTASARPLVLFVHGGGFNSGARNADYIVSVGEYLVRNGYAFASISYRLDTLVYTFEEINVDSLDFADPAFPLRPMANAMHDARAAVRFFRKNATQYRIDPNHIYMGGDSAGGITALLVGYNDAQDEIPADAVPQTVDGASGNSGYSSSVTGVWFGCARSYLLSAMEPNSTTNLIAGFYNQGDPLIQPRHSADVLRRSRDIGMNPRAIAFESGIHCSWLVPVFGFIDLVNYAATLKDALFADLSSSTARQRDVSDAGSLTMDVFPNPFHDELTITIGRGVGLAVGGRSKDISLKIYDVQGRMRWASEIQEPSASIRPGLPSGLYLLAIETDGDRPLRKAIVVQ